MRRALVLACVLSACSRPPSTPATSVVIDTLPGQVIRVRNTGPSGWTDTNGWKLVLERTLHPAPGAPGELGQPSAVVASSNGDIFVMEHKPVTINHYSADGTFIGTIGRAGAGPGEFHDYGVLYIAHDTLVHQDGSQSRLSSFTIAGKFITTWSSSPMAEHDLLADISGRIPVPANSGTTKLNSGHGVIRFRLDGSIADSIWYPSAPEPAVWRLKTDHADMGMLVPFAPDRVQILDRAGRLVWGDQSAGRFHYSTHGRDTVRIVEASFAPVPLGDLLRQATFDSAVARDKWVQGIAKLRDIPRTYPLWTAVVADGNNNLWVLLPGPRGTGDRWEVLDTDGRLLGAVPAPFDHADATFWTSDHVYVMQTANDATPEIAVYRIDKGAH